MSGPIEELLYFQRAIYSRLGSGMLCPPFRLVNNCRHFGGSHSLESGVGTKEIFTNQGSAKNRGINKQKLWNTVQKIPNIPQNIAGIFVWQLAILELSQRAASCLFVYFHFSIHHDVKIYFRLSSNEKRKENTDLRKVTQTYLIHTFLVLRIIQFNSPASTAAELRSGLKYLHIQSKAVIEK